jgi:two-component system NtrC family sensor kinase
MKITLILFCLVLCIQPLFSQEALFEKIRHEQDSLLNLIEFEPDDTKRIDLILDIYKTRVEAYPLMTLEVGQKLAKLAQKTKDPITETISWSFFGQGYRLSGNYTKGLECHHKAVALAEKIGNKSLIAIAKNQMAHIYKDREENEKALRIYQEALAIAREGKNVEANIWPMMNLGAIFLAMDQLDSSLYYSHSSYERCLDIKLYRNMPYILSNIGSAYSKMGNVTQANSFFNLAIVYEKEAQSARYTNMVYTALAEHYQRNKQIDSTIYFARKAIAETQNTVFTFLSIKPAKLLTDIYEKSNADSTLKYLRIYRAANDSLFSARAEQQLQMMTFEEEQRQHELATQKTNYQYKIKMNIMLGGLGTILLIALILFRNNKQKQKANALLHRQKKEIENTLSKLKNTQAQLVQSEKMASLGELTAGIAHEIQNPLNFVNNFSEVNTELIDEMQHELKTGNVNEAIAISNNIKENEEKINHHGKRADAIVKGMLQHSRSSSGVKEPTDINELADEYLRLAYHGLRAKDKSFEATIKTDFDPSIGLINVIPQDIGRVILNLITNAFYVVDEKKKHNKNGYEPTVTVTTKRTGQNILVSVMDNGNGIPKEVMDKIFQPFFTTKPTGQGTGLGLSLSYDIVKAHGGEITVETKENQGTAFIIRIPVT